MARAKFLNAEPSKRASCEKVFHQKLQVFTDYMQSDLIDLTKEEGSNQSMVGGGINVSSRGRIAVNSEEYFNVVLREEVNLSTDGASEIFERRTE
jgi:hypothetical protein